MSRQNKSIEDKTNELNELVAWFDSEDFSVEKAMEKFKEAEKIAKEVEQDLLTLKNEINIVKKRFDSED